MDKPTSGVANSRMVLRRSYQVMKAFLAYPRESLRYLACLPTMLRGFNYSEKWHQDAAHFKTAAPLEDANPLRDYYDAHKEGRGVWKWLHYFEIYGRHFEKFVGRDVNVLEIGVHKGGSLEMWQQYFGKKCHVYGIDIAESCRAYENDYTSIFIGDQADREFWRKFRREVPRIDILIDDGGHLVEQQIVTLEEMLPRLAPGGIYLCEDIFGRDNHFHSYLHGLVKNLSAIQTSYKLTYSSRAEEFQGCIKAIHVYPYVTVVEKLDQPEVEFSAPKRGTGW